jgi:hypothetical protein
VFFSEKNLSSFIKPLQFPASTVVANAAIVGLAPNSCGEQNT